MLIYLWLILLAPRDRLVCELWTRAIPTRDALVQACGTDTLANYRLDVTQNGIGICTIPAASLAWVREDCALSSPLDAYRLRIIEPDYQTAICTVQTPTDSDPAWDVITGQCPDAKKYGPNGIRNRFSGTRLTTPEPAPVCMPPSIEQPSSIATSETYHILAGKLIWYGLAKSNCDGGYSGVDPATYAATPCGLDGARPQMINWQNGLDPFILTAAREWNVPATLLKSLIARETQYWTWTGIDGEHGLIQITEDGAGVVMHVYQAGYYRMDATQQHAARVAWLRQLDCFNCSPVAAYEHAKQAMSYYAQALAAYYCMYGSWDDAVRVWNVKHKEN